VAKVGSVLVTTDPPGASVSIDGVARGHSPVELGGIRAGAHRITVSSEEGRVTTEVRVRAGERQDLHVPIFAGWIAAFAPVELQIFHRGAQMGTTESGRLMTAPGTYHLEFASVRGRFRAKRTVEVKPGEVAVVNIDVPPSR
jgi:hypothetical protein